MKRTSFEKNIIDRCKWFKTHTKGVAKLEKNQLEYLSNLPPRDRSVMVEFPIYCVVKMKDGVNDVKIPQIGKLGIVAGYKDGYVVVKEGPDGENKGFVRPDKLDKLAHWRGMTPSKLKRAVEWHKCKTKKERE